MRTTRQMTSPGRRPFLVVLLALALGGGALGLTGGVGPHGTMVAAESRDGGTDSDILAGDKEGDENAISGTPGWAHGDAVVADGGDATAD